MRIHLMDGASGKALENTGITISYGWQWLEYPYPEHDWGAWRETSDRLTCELDEHGWLEAPAHEVQPRGWYEGKYTRWPWLRRPRFTGIGIAAVTLRGFARVSLRPQDLPRFESFNLIVQVFDGWRAEMNWQPKKDSGTFENGHK